MSKKKIKEAREKTYIDLIDKLNKYGRCAFLRPVGFGKTTALSRIIKEEGYQKVAYFYPSKVVKDTAVDKYLENLSDEDKELIETTEEMKSIPNCDMMTYTKLARMKEDYMNSLENEYDLIIFDECHKIGGKKTKKNARKLLSINKNAHIIGATATPNRIDAYNVVHDIFKDITVYPYTLHDAFQDGLLLKPYYIYCTDPDMDTVRKDLKEEALTAGEDINDIRVKEVLNSKVFELKKLSSMDTMIRSSCDKYAKSDYLKFIVFFSSSDMLETHVNEVKNWFKNAYPEKSITELTIVSSDRILRENVDNLRKMIYQENHIDLIYCINMLNEGYHVDDLTGIIMYRCTHSETIYTQQLGRSLSSSRKSHPIVFDVVDNVHRKFYSNCSIKTQKNRKQSSNNVNIDNTIQINHNGTAVYIDSNIDNDNSIEIINNIDLQNDTDKDNSWYIHMNDTEDDDLLLVSGLASYRELIAKTVAEAMSIRCREAFICHFRKWCKYNNIPYPISDEELETVYKVNKNDFIKYFQQVIKENKLNYPMQDSQKLLDIGKNGKDGIPMEIFAKWKNVSVRAILDILEISA